MTCVATERYHLEYYADLLVPNAPDGAPVALLWHGITPNERLVMRPLAVELAARGAFVVVPDWSSSSQDNGSGALLASIEWTLARARAIGANMNLACLIGWSRGARAALGYVLDHPASPFGKVVGLAGQYGIRISTATRPPLESAKRQSDVRILLVHGTADTVLPVEGSQRLHAVLTEAGTACDIRVVDTDHAGVVLSRFNQELQVCVPERPMTAGQRATLDAILGFVFQV